MSTLFAQPKNAALTGFDFDDVESFAEQAESLRGSCGNPAEDFDFTFRDGEDIDEALFDAIGLREALLPEYFDAVDTWSIEEKLRVIIAVGECGAVFGPDSRPEDYEVTIYAMDSLKDLAKQLVEEGHFGEIPENIRPYLDMNAIARDLGAEYSETRIAGRNYVYWCR